MHSLAPTMPPEINRCVPRITTTCMVLPPLPSLSGSSEHPDDHCSLDFVCHTKLCMRHFPLQTPRRPTRSSFAEF